MADTVAAAYYHGPDIIVKYPLYDSGHVNWYRTIASELGSS